MRRVLALIALALLAVGAAPAAASTSPALLGTLSRSSAAAGSRSGAMVVELPSGRTLFASRADTPRVPASNEKLYTTSVSLLRFGAAGRLTTTVLGAGTLSAGTFTGNLYLRGGGDPTFGSAGFVSRAWGTGATVSDLARAVARAGIGRVRGDIVGDESYFDRRRGVPSTGYAFSYDIGAPLSALEFNRGLANTNGSAIQSHPAAFAANQLRAALRAAGVRVIGSIREGATPATARRLARVSSPPMSTLIRLTNVPSDNYLAEMLLKDLGAAFGAGGSTAAGTAVVRAQLARFGIQPAALVDGSGLSHRDHTSPRQVVTLLSRMAASPSLAQPFRSSLAVACRSGTLAFRMCGTAASGRCRGKTGTLSGVSALSGYCPVSGGRTIAFSFLMNGVGNSGAHILQNRMAAAIAAYG